MFIATCALKVSSRNIVVINSVHNIAMVRNISIMIWFKLFISEKNSNTFNVLAFMQVRTDENRDKNGCIQKLH